MSNPNPALNNVFQALADPTRRAVVHRLGNGTASTKDLAEPFDMALPSFMQHLSVLEESGLVTSEKIGRVRIWRIRKDELQSAETWFTEQRQLWEERTDRLVDFAEVLAEKEKQMTNTKREFTVSRTINAPRHIVWKAWVTPEYLEQWWVPRPMTARLTAFDLHPGGAFDLKMFAPDGNESDVTGSFLEIVNQERIVFTTALTADWRPAPTPLPITAYITMTDAGKMTRYDTRVLYRNDEDGEQLKSMDFPQGWSIGIDQLEVLAQTLK